MNQKLIDAVTATFDESQRAQAQSLLEQITTQHVMANSTRNLSNVRHAEVLLSEGSLDQLAYYVERAQIDFRDVIYWATQLAVDDTVEPGQD